MTKKHQQIILPLCLLLSVVGNLCAQTVGGVVMAWGGSNDHGETTVPVGLSNMTAIAAGGFHTLILKDDGTVMAWGAGTNDTGGTLNKGQSIVPIGLSNVTAVAGGLLHTVALKSNGTVVAWGAGAAATGLSYEYGQCMVPIGLSNVITIAARGHHTVVLKSDGTVVAWGNNPWGQTDVPIGLSNVTTIAAGYNNTVIVKSDGTVRAWGYNAEGQSDVPIGLSNVTAIAAGDEHTVALKSDGTVVAWGDNSVGQTNVPIGLSNVTAIAAGAAHTVALKSDGTMVAWGWNASVPAALNGIRAVACGAYHTLALVPARIDTQPRYVTANATSNVTFAITAFGPSPLSYQWFKDGVAMSEATNTTLTFIATNRALSGIYSVRVSNNVGSVTSLNASLRVLVPQRIESPSIMGDGRVLLTFRDEDGVGVPDTLSQLLLLSTDEFSGTNTVWTPNPSGFTTTNGYIQTEDIGATNVFQRFYRVMEW